MMAAVQQRVVDAQVASWAERHRCCEACGARRQSKGSYPVVFLTLYGDVRVASPRLRRCPCQGADGPATVSLLRNLIPDYVAPERLYLETRWASLVPYAAAAGLLADILPIAAGANGTTLRDHVLRVAERAAVTPLSQKQKYSSPTPEYLPRGHRAGSSLASMRDRISAFAGLRAYAQRLCRSGNRRH